ncbi:MAG: Ig-like domain-containing protein, partial [Prevotella sp.]|nr:Ig-like domain-containing protein [Prevotella sp.]
MKHFYLSLITLFLVALTTACGGGDDDNTDTGGGGQTTSAPKVVSVSPVNGATDIATGEVTVTLTYDQAIRLTSTSRSSIQISGGTVESIGISNALLKIIVSCPTYNTTVALTIPKGLVTNVSQQQAEAYSLSFTTVKETEPVSPSIPATPQTASTDAAKKLYSYFVEQYGQKTISSVMANVNWNNECAEKVYKLTGKYPAMNCYDFIHVCFSP